MSRTCQLMSAPTLLSWRAKTLHAYCRKCGSSPSSRNYVTHPLRLDTFDGTTLALYIGTSIGNYSPEEAQLILRNLCGQLQTGDALLLGTDMVKDERALLAAYDDNDGITAAFNLNILHRLNRELGANFDAARFRHRAIWNSIESRIEMHLESAQEQDVSNGGGGP